jgi:O-acetylhomoserine/O-acetylserine sulfhydrylase-like pyridoxal-dependent enzyme
MLQSEQFSLKSVISVTDDLASVAHAPGSALVGNNKKDDVDNTEAFIIHSDHLTNVELKKVESSDKNRFCQTGGQNSRLAFKEKLNNPSHNISEIHPMTERPAERASIDSLYSANQLRYP